MTTDYTDGHGWGEGMRERDQDHDHDQDQDWRGEAPRGANEEGGEMEWWSDGEVGGEITNHDHDQDHDQDQDSLAVSCRQTGMDGKFACLVRALERSFSR